MDDNDINAMQKEVQQFLEIVEPHVESNSQMTWKPSDGFLTIVFRAILRRQFEGLQAISQLVAVDKGFVAGPLLRPACEELIWAKYLTSILAEDANQLVLSFALDERHKSLSAQHKFAGKSVTETLGLLPFLQESKDIRKIWRERIRELGTRLRWPERSIRDCQLPSMRWLADKTEELSTYKYVYHGTSRYVHFSAHNLGRLGWGNPYEGSLSVSSVHLKDYGAHFCLYWGLELFVRTEQTLTESGVLVQAEMDAAKSNEILAILERIGKFGIPPIIKAEELAWPTDTT